MESPDRFYRKKVAQPKHCGIYPFQTRKDPQLWRVNIGCLEGVDPYAPEASVANGVGLSVVEDA